MNKTQENEIKTYKIGRFRLIFQLYKNKISDKIKKVKMKQGKGSV